MLPKFIPSLQRLVYQNNSNFQSNEFFAEYTGGFHDTSYAYCSVCVQKEDKPGQSFETAFVRGARNLRNVHEKHATCF
jgi:hypothetical protein